MIIVGPSRYSTTGNPNDVVASTDPTADAVKGASAVTVASTAQFAAGQIVLLDETPAPAGGPTHRVAARFGPPLTGGWSGRSTTQSFPASTTSQPASSRPPGTAGSWFSRLDRPTAEVKQIASISGATITFTTPIHISYRSSHAAQLSRYGQPHVKNAGVEDLKLIGGDDGNLRFQWAALSWARNVDNTVWHGEGFAIENSFRIELREFYVHDAAWAQPGGGGYAISLSHGTAEVLIENGISVRANKVMVARSAGAGSVVGYNYVDMGYINSIGSWIEVGLNASHMVGPTTSSSRATTATTPIATTPTATASTTRSSAITCVASAPPSTIRRAGGSMMPLNRVTALNVAPD